MGTSRMKMEWNEDRKCEADVRSFVPQENLNLVCDASRYSLTTQHALSQLNEKEIPFELIEVWGPSHVVCCLRVLVVGVVLAGPPPPLQDDEHARGCAHIPPRVELHLLSAQTPWQPSCIWYVVHMCARHYTHAHIHAHTHHTCTHIQYHTHMHTHTIPHTHAHTCTHVQYHTHAHTYSTHIHTYTLTHTHIHTYTHTHTHLHTHMHIHIHQSTVCTHAHMQYPSGTFLTFQDEQQCMANVPMMDSQIINA